MNREAIYLALFNLAKASTQATTAYRTLIPIDQIPSANLPALIQTQVDEPRTQNKGNPAVIKLNVDLRLYAETPSNQTTDPTQTAATQLNTMLDALDVAMAPDPVTQVQTLGGLVSHAWITGAHYFEDALSNRAAVLVTVEMLLDDSSSSQYSFDSGAIYMIDSANPNSTPQLVGGLQEINASVKFDTNTERGNFQYTVKAMRRAASITCKAKFAQIKGAVLAQLLYGQTLSTGGQRVAPVETHTIPATPYQITVTNATWALDLGVIYDGGTNKGKALTFVTGAPSAGQYSVTAGVYTFAAADTGLAVSISYLYTVATGNQMTLSNPYSVVVPNFIAVLNSSDGAKQVTWKLNACYSDQLDFVTRLEDFTMPEFSFTAQADASNVIGTFSYSS